VSCVATPAPVCPHRTSRILVEQLNDQQGLIIKEGTQSGANKENSITLVGNCLYPGFGSALRRKNDADRLNQPRRGEVRPIEIGAIKRDAGERRAAPRSEALVRTAFLSDAKTRDRL
jgi:hypothetical protein